VKTSKQNADGRAVMKAVMKAIARAGPPADPYVTVDALAYVIGVILASAEGPLDDERLDALAAVAAKRIASAMRDYCSSSAVHQ
jgi:hypothetical protein